MVRIESIMGTPEGAVIRHLKLPPFETDDEDIFEAVKKRAKRFRRERFQKKKAKRIKREKVIFKEATAIEEYTIKRLKRLKRLKPSPKTKKELQRVVEKVFMTRRKSNSQLKAQRKHQLKMAKIRLQQIRAQQEQAAYQQDPRYEKTGAREHFLEDTDPQHERNVEMARQMPQIYTQEQPSHFTSRFSNFSIRNLLNKVALYNQRRGARPENLRGLPPELADQIRRAQNPAAGQATILQAENRLMPMRPEAGKISLMGSERIKTQPTKLNFWKAE